MYAAPGPEIDDYGRRRGSHPPSCSTTITVCPDRQATERGSSRALSCWCSPIEVHEDVHHARETRGPPGWRAGCAAFHHPERIGSAIKPQVIDAHVGQKAQPHHDVAHDALGHRGAPPDKSRAKMRQGLPDGTGVSSSAMRGRRSGTARARLFKAAWPPPSGQGRLAAVPAELFAYRA